MESRSVTVHVCDRPHQRCALRIDERLLLDTCRRRPERLLHTRALERAAKENLTFADTVPRLWGILTR